MRGVEMDEDGGVNVKLTAEDWELYTVSLDCTEAARALNTALGRAVNAGASREEAAQETLEVMDAWREYGADDTEPRARLAEVLDAVYGVHPSP